MKKLAIFAILALMTLPARAFADATEQTLCAVSINGREVSQGTIVVRESDGTYALLRDQTVLWGLLLPTKGDQTYQGGAYVPLRTIPDLTVVFDASLQRIDLTVPPRYFDKTTIDLNAQNTGTPSRSRGAFLTYDVRTQSFSGQAGTSTMVFAAGSTLGVGTLNADFVGAFGDPSNQLDGIRRIDSYWQKDDINKHTTLQIGDSSYVSDALVPGNPFFGVQYGTNFTTAPDMIINPMPSISGAAASDSNADIFVDGKLVLQQQIPTGLFQIENIPLAGSSGTVRVIVKDAQGRTQTLATPYYTSPSLIKRGLSEFSWGAGTQSVQTATGTPVYDGALLQGFRRYGFTNRFTGEADGQLAKGANSLSGGGVWGFPKVGLFDAALSLGQQSGHRYDYEYLGRAVDFGFGVSSLVQQNPIIALGGGVQTPVTPSRNSTAFLSVPFLSRSSLTMSLSNEDDGPASATRMLTADYTLSLGQAQLNLELLKSSGSFVTNAVTLTYSVPLGPHQYASATAENQDGATSAALTYESDPVLDARKTQPGYTATVGSSDYEASLDYPLQRMDLSAAYAKIGGNTSDQFDANGSLGVMRGRLFASRSITQAYGLAIVPGWAHIHVYANGELAGTTNARGEVLLPNLIPYQKNVITIDAQDFPATANVESLSQTVIPYYNTPVTAVFPVHGNGGVIMHMTTADGSYVPAGAVLTVNGELWPIADLGEAYVGGASPGPLTIGASWDASHCTAYVVLPKDMTNIPNIGKVICR